MQVEKPAGGAPGARSGGWGSEDTQGQKQDRETWRAEKDSNNHHRSWNGPTDHNHQPGQQDRFAPQLGRGRPQPGSDTTAGAKSNERWRDDGQNRSLTCQCQSYLEVLSRKRCLNLLMNRRRMVL